MGGRCEERSKKGREGRKVERKGQQLGAIAKNNESRQLINLTPRKAKQEEVQETGCLW